MLGVIRQADMLDPPLVSVASGLICHRSPLVIHLEILGIHHGWRFEPWGDRVASKEPHDRYLTEPLLFFHVQ